MSKRSPWSVVRSPLQGDGDHSPVESNYGSRTTDHGLPTSDIRVVLFDIDGTLIKTVRRGEYRGLIHAIAR